MAPTSGTAEPSTGRKRPKNERTPTSRSSSKSRPSSTLPRISSAQAYFLGASHDASQTDFVKVAPPSQQHNASVSDVDLEAMISNLSLIYKYGYGSDPGMPSVRCITVGSSRRGRRGNVTAENHRSSRGSVLKGRGILSGKRSNKDSQEDSSQSPRAPWTAPSNSSAGIGRPPWTAPLSSRAGLGRPPWAAPLNTGAGVGRPRERRESKEEPFSKAMPVTNAIEREDFKRNKARREAASRARSLLSQLGRILRREDLVAAAQLLKLARAKFRAAGDRSGVCEVDAAMTKIKADLVVKAMGVARGAREYDRMQKLMFEAQHYFAILTRLGQLQRHDDLCKSERREADLRIYEGFLHPHRLCRDNALEDGRASRQAALHLARKRKYDAARSRLGDARRCFEWAGGADKEMKKLQRVVEDLEVRENEARGNRLTESVTSKVQFLSPKDYRELFAKLSEAATAYGVARDDEGAQVVRVVTAGLRAVRSAEESWLALINALKERIYPSASQHLGDAKRLVLDATKGLPVVSPSLARAAKILSPAGGVTPLDIVAELAALDGLRDHGESIRLLNQGLLDKAQQLNTSARKVLEFTARSYRKRGGTKSSSGDGGGNGETIGKGVVSADHADESDKKLTIHPTGGKRGSLQLSRSKRRGRVFADERAAQDQQALPTGGRSTPGEGTAIDSPFALSDEQLKEGEALLLRIRRSTSASTEADGSGFKSRWTSSHSGLRDRVEDILDEVSEKEDVITRRKALERGDKLMSLFWELVAASGARATPEKSGSFCWDKDNHSSGKSNKGAITSARAPGNAGRQRSEEVSGVLGGKLSPKAAEKCLCFLVEAREAYDGQGFGKQADRVTRLRAGIMADRCLALAPALAPTTRATAGDEAAQSASAGRPTTPAAAAAAHSGLTSGGCDGFRSVEAFEAARAAAREAEANYARAGNTGGALRARRTEVSLKGDEAMVEVAPLLQQRKYVGALQRMHRARSFYIDAGPEGAEGLSRVNDPDRLVKAIAVEDGRHLKDEAVRLLRGGDVERATDLRSQAQRCFSFVDREGLADATADIDAAAHMVTRFASGDDAAAAAEEALERGEIGRATALLREAKSLYRKAQSCYEELVDQVTGLLGARPNDPEAALKAIELQDNINGIYDSRIDGKRVARVESCLDCLAADESLANLAQVIDYEQFEDAHILLLSAAKVYERSADHFRLSKVNRIISFVGLVEKAVRALDNGHYVEAVKIVSESLRARSAIIFERPISLRPPDCKLLRGGKDAVSAAVLSWVRNAGEVVAVSASGRLEWRASHAAYASPGEADVRAAKAKQTQAEALMITAEALYGSGELEASAEHLRSARVLLLKAAKINDATAAEQPYELVYHNNTGDVGTNDVSTATKLENLLEKNKNFQSRIAGDIAIRGVLPALHVLDYDEALRLMLKAEGHYATVKMEKWLTSAVTAYQQESAKTTTAPKSTSAGATALSPRDLVVKRAALDGDRFRAEAVTAIGKEKDPAKAEELLCRAVASMEWAGVESIKNIEYIGAGDDICRRLADLLRERQTDRVKEELEEALGMYRQGDAFGKIADTQAVAFCVEREKILCSDFVSAVTAGDPATAEKVLEESRPLFKTTAEMKSEVLQDVAELMNAKHQHIELLITFCRTWAKCLPSVTLASAAAAATTEDDPNLACTLDAILSDIRHFSASGAAVLNVSWEVLERALASAAEPSTLPEPDIDKPDDNDTEKTHTSSADYALSDSSSSNSSIISIYDSNSSASSAGLFASSDRDSIDYESADGRPHGEDSTRCPPTLPEAASGARASVESSSDLTAEGDNEYELSTDTSQNSSATSGKRRDNNAAESGEDIAALREGNGSGDRSAESEPT